MSSTTWASTVDSRPRAGGHIAPRPVTVRDPQARLLTSREAAERLCMSHEWLRKKVQHREIPFVRLGRHVRFTEAQLAQIIEGAVQAVPIVTDRGSARSKL